MHCRKRFTLVELLVVIAIISVLAGMLLPALNNAMTQARLITCTSNERQLYLVFTSYFGDWSEHLPSPFNRSDRPHLLGAHQANVYGLGVFLHEGYLEDGSIVLCPDNKAGNLADINKLCDKVSGSNAWSTYFVNGVNHPYQSYVQLGFGALEWDNKVDFHARMGIASRLRGNLIGGLLERGTAVAHLRSPRSFLTCAFNRYETDGYNPHDMSGVNVLFADGVISQCRFDEWPYLGVVPLEWKEKFVRCIDYSYPNYRSPQ